MSGTLRGLILTSKLYSTTTKFVATSNPATNRSYYRNFSSTIAKMGVHNLANKDEFSAALKANKLVVVDAFATWCGPCKVIAPHIVKFSEEFPSVHFAKIDVDDVPDVAQELGIRVMPTFIIFKGEEKVGEILGANPKALQAAIEKIVKAEESA